MAWSQPACRFYLKKKKTKQFQRDVTRCGSRRIERAAAFSLIKVKEETLSAHEEDEAVRGVADQAGSPGTPVMYFAHSKLQRKKTPTELPNAHFEFN